MTIADRAPEQLEPKHLEIDNNLDNKFGDKHDGATENLWLAAIKPPMYSVAIIPIVTGTAVAYHETRFVNWQIFATFLIGAVLILAWENLSNDVFDSETGIDKNKPHSLVNLTGRKDLILIIANICLTLGVALVLSISWQQQNLVVVGIIGLCCGLGYSYQGHPFRFGYHGWGEVIAFICFGPLAISAAFYSQTQTFSVSALVASIIVGITTSIILFCSHFHQLEDDLAAGKLSPIVRLGTDKASQLLPWLIAVAFVTTIIGICLGYFPVATSLVFLSLGIAIKLANFVRQNHHEPAKIKNCKFIAVAWHFWSGLLLGLGFILPF